MNSQDTYNSGFMDSNHDTDESVNIREGIKKYIEKWRWFLLSIFIMLGISLIYLRYAPNQYLVTATIFINDEDKGGMSSELSAFEDLGLMKGAKTSIINEIGVLNSRTLLENVIKELKINISYFGKGRVNNSEFDRDDIPYNINFFIPDSVLWKIDTSFIITTISQTHFEIKTSDEKVVKKVLFGRNIVTDFGEINITPLDISKIVQDETLVVNIEPLEKVVNDYIGRINVEPETKNSSLLILSLEGPVKMKSERILNKLIEEYNKDAIAYKSLITENTDKFINERIEDISSDLTNVDKYVEQFKTTNKLTDIEYEANLVLDSNSKLEKTIVDLNSQLKLVDYVIDYMTINKNDLIPENLGLKDAKASQNTIIYNRLILERNRILKNSSEKNPTIINLDEQISTLRESTLQSLGNLKSSITFSLDEAERQGNSLNRKRTLAPKQEREFQDIKRRQQIIETLYLYLLKKREENAISIGVPVPNAKVIDRANGSDRPVAPKKIVIITIGFLVGLLLPMIIISIISYFDNKIHTSDDVEKIVHAPILGEVPKSKLKETYLALSHQNNPIAESLRLIRTNLNFMFSSNDDNYGKCIFTTSTIGGEGKTFVSINLATSLASSNSKVLLIEADLRKPKMKKYLNIQPSSGLSNYLAGKISSIEEIVLHLDLPNIDVIVGGEIPPNPADLLLNSKFDHILDYGKKNYDYVLIDTPPISLVTDTLLLSKFADLFIYVIRADHMDKSLLKIPRKLFESKRLGNMSVVINGTDNKRRGYGYGYGSQKE